MTTIAIKNEVERRVNKRFMPALFEKTKKYHAKNEYLNCSCDYCTLKRVATIRIANANKSERNKIRIIMKKRLNNTLWKESNV